MGCDRNISLWFPKAPRNAPISVVEVRGGSDYPLLAAADAQRLAGRARMRLLGNRDSGFNAFAAAIAEMEGAK